MDGNAGESEKFWYFARHHFPIRKLFSLHVAVLEPQFHHLEQWRSNLTLSFSRSDLLIVYQSISETRIRRGPYKCL